MTKTLNTIKQKLYKLVVNYHALNNSIKTNAKLTLSGELEKIILHLIVLHNINTNNHHLPLNLHFGRFENN